MIDKVIQLAGLPENIPAATAVTLIGGVSGLASYITMMAISTKITGRNTLTTKEIVLASIAVAASSVFAYYLVKTKEQEEFPTY